MLGFETNYYRFEVEKEQTVEAELILEARKDLGGITDSGDSSVADADIGGDNANVTQIKAIGPFEVEEGVDELFLKLETDGRSGEGENAGEEFPIKFVVNVEEAEETTVEQTTTLKTSPPENASLEETTQQTSPEDTSTGQTQSGGREQQPRTIESEQSGGSSNTLLIAIIVVLVALVAALGGAPAVVLFMRR